MQALVSVVIPNYNNDQYLAEAISSAISQTYKNLEINFINDGSPDDSNEILQSFGSKIRLIKQKHQEATSARNPGIRSAKGDYIAFLDSDDIWKLNKIELKVAKIQSGKYGLFYCSLQEFFLAGELERIHLARYEARIIHMRLISSYLKTFAKIGSLKNFTYIFFMLLRRIP